MSERKFKYIYGPIFSWRLGRSLGIDPISSEEKVCSFDCVYCQIGPTGVLTDERKVFVQTSEVVSEIESLPEVEIDYMTFSGRGEPTLAANLGEMIQAAKGVRGDPVAVITNSSLIGRKDVREDLMLADFVLAKLDAASQEVFERINSPIAGAKIGEIIEGIRRFRDEYAGKLALQMMFLEENVAEAGRMAEIARSLEPDEVEINTPLRECAVKPLPKREIERIASLFEGMNVITVYEGKKGKTQLISDEETVKRRGKRI